ncbi:MAG: hypothetical protein RH862_05575 [Leptospiraceae bacterium]
MKRTLILSAIPLLLLCAAFSCKGDALDLTPGDIESPIVFSDNKTEPGRPGNFRCLQVITEGSAGEDMARFLGNHFFGSARPQLGSNACTAVLPNGKSACRVSIKLDFTEADAAIQGLKGRAGVDSVPDTISLAVILYEGGDGYSYVTRQFCGMYKDRYAASLLKYLDTDGVRITKLDNAYRERKKQP